MKISNEILGAFMKSCFRKSKRYRRYIIIELPSKRFMSWGREKQNTVSI